MIRPGIEALKRVGIFWVCAPKRQKLRKDCCSRARFLLSISPHSALPSNVNVNVNVCVCVCVCVYATICGSRFATSGQKYLCMYRNPLPQIFSALYHAKSPGLGLQNL